MIFYDAGGLESQFLKSVLDIKNVEYRTEVVASECAIGDKELLILDLFPALKYLDERYPVPKLFSSDPGQNARLTMFVLDIMQKAYKTGDYTKTFDELGSIPMPYTFLLGENITIADLILYPILPDTKHWNEYKQKIEELLTTTQ